ncbi:MAG TPA: hypothetical protein VKG92_09185 [Flavobacteriales bacterium]|nr:hypothetical protein [Flavobacteriales bacterium]
MPPLTERISLSLITVLVLWTGIATMVVRYPPENILSWDTFGYYLYLPANLLHHDPALEDQQWVHDVLDTYHNTGSFYQAGELPDGRWVMKYPMGLAVLWSPFFAIGHLVAGIIHQPQDGFSAPYQWSIIWAMLAYAFAGLLVLRRVLKEFFSDGITTTVLVLIVLGTNYLHQAVYSTGMPHVFLFTLYAGVLWHGIRWHREHRRRDVVMLAVLLGLLALSRPSEIVAVFIPLLIGLARPAEWKEHFRALWQWRAQLGLALGIMLLIGAPQLIYWKWLTGKFLYMSYNNPGEGFEFLHPYFAEVLFSFRKGWYIYTPMMAVATGGLFVLRRYLPSLQWGVIVFFVLNLYIVSSWSCWWYADSFGQRSLVQSYAVMALPLGAVIAWLAGRRWLLRSVGCVVLLAFTGLNMLQTWQSAEGIVHGSRMTWPAYRAGFGKTDWPAGMDTLLLVDRSCSMDQGPPELRGYSRRPLVTMREREVDHGNDFKMVSPRAGQGLVPQWESPAIRIPWERITPADGAWVEINCYLRPLSAAEPSVELVATFLHNGYPYCERATGSWKRDASGKEYCTLWYLTPEVRNVRDPLKIFCRSRDIGQMRIDRLEVSIYEPTLN